MIFEIGVWLMLNWFVIEDNHLNKTIETAKLTVKEYLLIELGLITSSSEYGLNVYFPYISL